MVCSITAALVILESALRYYLKAAPFEPKTISVPMITSHNENLRWLMSATKSRDNLDLLSRVFADKKPNEYRILFIGDSLVFRGDTSSGELYTQVIEKELKQSLKDDVKDISVINAGVRGYTTYQELEFLKLYGKNAQPDLIILGYVFNDVYYKYLHRPNVVTFKLDHEPESLLNVFSDQTVLGDIFKNSYVAHGTVFATGIFYKKILRQPVYEFERRSDFFLAWKDHGWIDTDRLFGEMKKLLNDANIKMLVVIFPVSEQVHSSKEVFNESYVLYPQKRIKEILQKYEIPWMDLTSAINEGGGEKLFFDYLHLNSDGNDLVATEVTNHLLNRFPLQNEVN